MRKLMLSVASLLMVAAAAHAQVGGGEITGRVTARGSGTPLPGARVAIEALSLVTSTDEYGGFRLAGVPGGVHTVVFTALRYAPARHVVTVVAGEPAHIEVALAEAPIELSEVVVTATREADAKAETPANIGVVGREAIDETRPHHPAELMSQVPGVLVLDLGGEGNTAAIRQPINFKPVYAYLEDGVPIRSTGFFNHNALYEVNIPAAGRVEVFKGPGTALHGSDAIGGVVNVLTREPSVEPSVELFAEGGRFGYARTLLGASRSFGGHGLRADLNLTHYSGFRHETEQDRQSASLRWDRTFSPTQRLKTVIAFNNINSPGDGGSDLSRALYVSSPRVNLTPIAQREVRSARWSTAYERHGERGGLSLTGYARYSKLGLLPSWQLTYDPEIWEIRNYSVGLLAQARRHLEPMRTALIVGLDLDLSPGTHVSDSITPVRQGSTFVDYTVAQRLYDYDVTFHGVSPYVQADFSPLARVRVSLGLRYDRLGYDYENKLGTLQTGNHRRPASTSVAFEHLSPKAGVTVEISPSVNAFASYRHSFRVPSEDQLFRQGSALNTVGLEPVRARSYEAGVRARLGRAVAVEASAYTMDVSDDILEFFNTANLTSETSNAGRSRHRGVEVGLTAALASRVRLDVAYTYAVHRYLEWVTATGTDFSGHEIQSAPRHIANSRLTVLPFGEHGSVALEWQHLGRYYTDPENQHTYPGHDLFNLHFTAPVVAGFDLVGRVNNLANTRWATTASFNPFLAAAEQDRFTPGLPRTFFLGAQYRWSGK